MATLAANDQENAIRHLHAGAASKSLNAGMKSLNGKPSGNMAPKTPFKVALNDENATIRAGKSILKTNSKGSENLLLTSKKGGKLDANAFITPAGPRNRAPLGMKTTNAKSQAFATPGPAPLSANTQKLSPRLRRPKVKIHQPEAEVESEDDVPEIEYMPPKEIPLLDELDDYQGKDWNFPQIDDATMVRSIWQAYTNPVEDDGRTRKQREFEEEYQRERKKRDTEFERVFGATMDKYDAEAHRYFGVEEPALVAAPKKTVTGISTIRARSAAAALSKPTSVAPKRIAKANSVSIAVPGRRPMKPLAAPLGSRQAATAALKSTIGYAQGRAGRTTSTARKPLPNLIKPAPSSATSRSHSRSASAHVSASRSRSVLSHSDSSAAGARSGLPHQGEPYHATEEMERQMELLMLSESDSEEENAWMKSFRDQLQGDAFEEESEFQFTIPEGL